MCPAHEKRWKHPHRRGEDCLWAARRIKSAETPPQAWGGPWPARRGRPQRGNTPTGVGRTLSSSAPACLSRKHPHRRGEDFVCVCFYFIELETPPQAWGGRTISKASVNRLRNTPTGVGRTSQNHRQTKRVWKHPHRRGEDFYPSRLILRSSETPPQAWGGPRYLLGSA